MNNTATGFANIPDHVYGGLGPDLMHVVEIGVGEFSPKYGAKKTPRVLGKKMVPPATRTPHP